MKEQRLNPGTRVFLREDFKNGAHKPDQQRFYPAGTAGKVLEPNAGDWMSKQEEEDLPGVRLEMEDPPGKNYRDKVIVVPREGILLRKFRAKFAIAT